MQKWVILSVVLIVILGAVYIVMNIDIETEYTPEIEIDEENMRKTMVSLYFMNKETKEIDKETRLIDSKELLKDPYKKMLKLLLDGPKSENFERIIPEDTEIVGVNLEGDVLTIGFTSNFLKVFENEEAKNLVISSISKTLTEFKEVNSINIVIEEKEG